MQPRGTDAPAMKKALAPTRGQDRDTLFKELPIRRSTLHSPVN